MSAAAAITSTNASSLTTRPSVSSGRGSPNTIGPAAIVHTFAAALVTAITGTAFPTCRLRAEMASPINDRVRITSGERVGHHGDEPVVHPAARALIDTSDAPHTSRGGGKERAPAGGGTLLAASAGLVWGASDVSIKALSGRVDDGFVAVMAHPLALVILTLSLIGLAISARSLQVGKAVPVIAVTSAAANVCTIAACRSCSESPCPTTRSASW